MGLARKVHVLTAMMVVVATGNLATKICLVRIWKNKQRSFKSSKRNTIARRSTVKGGGTMTPLTAAPPCPLMRNRKMGVVVHWVLICVTLS
jgi:hypothetical protein